MSLIHPFRALVARLRDEIVMRVRGPPAHNHPYRMMKSDEEFLTALRALTPSPNELNQVHASHAVGFETVRAGPA